MDIESELLKEHSRNNAIRITNYIGADKNRFSELLNLFFAENYRVTQRAAWVVQFCAKRHPELIQPHLEKMVVNLENPIHVAVKRNTVRILQDMDLPEKVLGKVAHICFNLLQSAEETIAVKVFSMTVLSNIVSKEPDLANELKLIIEEQMPYGSAGFKSRGKKILKKLEKLRLKQ